jgi:hypothetical protein
VKEIAAGFSDVLSCLVVGLEQRVAAGPFNS